MQAEITPVPIQTPYWNRVEHGWPLDLKVLRGLLKFFLTFLVRDEKEFLPAVSFVNVKIMGRGKE